MLGIVNKIVSVICQLCMQHMPHYQNALQYHGGRYIANVFIFNGLFIECGSLFGNMIQMLKTA